MIAWAHPSPKPKRHLSTFSHFCRAHDCERPTDRPTDRQTTLLSLQKQAASTYVVLRCSLKILTQKNYHKSSNRSTRLLLVQLSDPSFHLRPGFYQYTILRHMACIWSSVLFDGFTVAEEVWPTLVATSKQNKGSCASCEDSHQWMQVVWPGGSLVVSINEFTSGPVSTGMGDRLQMGKYNQPPGQLSLVIPLWTGAMNTCNDCSHW